LSLPTSLTPKSAGNINIGEEGRKAVREAAAAHNSHLPPGMEKLQINWGRVYFITK
jgi:hypothetical protein